MVTEKQFNFSPLYFFFFISFPSWVNSIIPQFNDLIAPNHDLLMDELNVIYFVPKWLLYNINWLPRTTDNLTYFAQSLGIRGIDSRLLENTLSTLIRLFPNDHQ